MSVYKWRFGLFNEFTLNSHLYFRMRKKRGVFFITSSIQLHPEPGPTLWADKAHKYKCSSQLRSFSTTYPYPEDSVTKLSWGHHQLLLRTGNNLSSWRAGSRFFTRLCFTRRFFVVVVLLPATSRGAPRKNAMTGTFISVASNCSEVFWRCLAKLWHWIGMKKNSTEGKNNFPAMAALWKDPFACRFPQVVSGWVGDRATNAQILLKASKFYLKCWAGIVTEWIFPDLRQEWAAKFPTQN